MLLLIPKLLNKNLKGFLKNMLQAYQGMLDNKDRDLLDTSSINYIITLKRKKLNFWHPYICEFRTYYNNCLL